NSGGALPAHAAGIDDGSAAYADQSGVGAADPTQVNARPAFPMPVARSAGSSAAAPMSGRNSPTPPLRIPRIGNVIVPVGCDPATMLPPRAIFGAYVQAKPSRGL